MFSGRYLLYVTLIFGTDTVLGLCGSGFRWSHNFNMEFVYGKWYGVGYARHSPYSKLNDIDCVTLFIKDITAEVKDDWLDWNVVTIPRRNYTGQSWSSYRRSFRPSSSLSRYWPNRSLRRAKRDMYQERHVQIVWDQDGQVAEHSYVYSPEAPGLWTTEKWELRSRGINVWHPGDPPLQPDVIRILKATPELLIINHCSDIDENGTITLVLRRHPAHIEGWLGYEFDRELIDLDLPSIHRKATTCAACTNLASFVFVAAYLIVTFIV